MTFTDAEVSAYLVAKASDRNPDNWAYVPDRDHSSKWKLPLVDESGDISARHIGMAIAALGPGFRGNEVQIPAADLPAVKRKVLAAWRQVHPDLGDEDIPNVLKGGVLMDQQELEQKLGAMEKQLSDAVAKVDTLEAIAKTYRELETKDRDIFAALTAEQQAEFVKAETTEERKGELLKKAAPEPEELPEPIRKRLEDVEKRAKAAEEENLKLARQIAKAADEKLTATMIAKAEAEFPNLPGTKEEKGAVLKSLNCLTEEQREAIFKLFASGDAAIAQLGRAKGSDSTQDATVSKSWEAVEKRAVAWAQEAGRNVSKAVAVTEFLGTPEGSQAYTKYLESEKK